MTLPSLSEAQIHQRASAESLARRMSYSQGGGPWRAGPSRLTLAPPAS